MKRFVTFLVIVTWLLPVAVGADLQPAKGRLLVATDLVGGDFFNQTVVLLLHYDANGAMGVVINRPTEIEPQEILDDIEDAAGYSDQIYWGGPVQMNSLRALLRTDSPPSGAEAIVGSVHQVPVDDALKGAPSGQANLRLFIGYAGWAAGQLDDEMARGSWHVVPATDELVFAEDPHTLWKTLTRPRELRAALSISH